MAASPYIACDARPDGEQCHVEDQPTGGPRTFTEARARLARQGWHRRPDGRDICPDCWTAGHR